LHFGVHVGDFFGAFVDEQDKELTLRMIAEEAVDNLLKEDGFAGEWRSDDETTLSLANGGEQVEDTHRDVLGARLPG
jgi:hypothetical protein